jgi:hypothetical protein
MSVRAERAVEAARLKAEGVPWREACARMGISRAYFYELLNDPDGSADRARKDSYRGECVECGAATNGSNGRALAPKLCLVCNARRQGALNRVWTRELIVSRIREWRDVYGEPPTMRDWSRHRLKDEGRAKRFEGAVSHWPSCVTVHEVFGSWNAAIRAAGFAPRANHGGGGNQARKRSVRERAA